jgi:general secretion pathway protein G
MVLRLHHGEIRGGFTLMEMMVVVAIIVLLAAMAAPMVMGRMDQAKIDRARVDCKTIAQQADMFKLKYGDNPQTLDQLTQPGSDGTAPFIEARYLIDPWRQPYQYSPAGTHTGYPKAEVWSNGPPGANKMIGSWE